MRLTPAQAAPRIVAEARAAWPELDWAPDDTDPEAAEAVLDRGPITVVRIDPSWHSLATHTLRYEATWFGADGGQTDALGRTVAEALGALRRRLPGRRPHPVYGTEAT